MSEAFPDQIPQMCTVTLTLDDGGKIIISHPRIELDMLSPEDKEAFLVSLGHFIGMIERGLEPYKEDLDRIMAIEGASIILPELHGEIEMQTLFGGTVLSGNQVDLAKYQQPE